MEIPDGLIGEEMELLFIKDKQAFHLKGSKIAEFSINVSNDLHPIFCLGSRVPELVPTMQTIGFEMKGFATSLSTMMGMEQVAIRKILSEYEDLTEED